MYCSIPEKGSEFELARRESSHSLQKNETNGSTRLNLNFSGMKVPTLPKNETNGSTRLNLNFSGVSDYFI